MLWIIPTCAILCVSSFFLGYYLYRLSSAVTEVKETVKLKVDKKPEVEDPKSIFIDPTDEVQNAIYEREQLMKKMNQ